MRSRELPLVVTAELHPSRVINRAKRDRKESPIRGSAISRVESGHPVPQKGKERENVSRPGHRTSDRWAELVNDFRRSSDRRSPASPKQQRDQRDDDRDWTSPSAIDSIDKTVLHASKRERERVRETRCVRLARGIACTRGRVPQSARVRARARAPLEQAISGRALKLSECFQLRKLNLPGAPVRFCATSRGHHAAGLIFPAPSASGLRARIVCCESREGSERRGFMELRVFGSYANLTK